MSEPANTGSEVAPRPGLRPDALGTSVAILLAVSVVQRSIGFGRGILFCRWLTPEQLGYWEMAYSFLLLAAPIAVLGIPGSLGRYLERYRQRNQLQTFLRRTITWTAALGALAVLLILMAAPWFSRLIFGQPDQTTLVVLLALSLAAVILHHFLGGLFAALRMFRIVTAMNFIQSILFAAISLALLWRLPMAAECIVLAYGTACAVSSAATLFWMRRPLVELAGDGGGSVSHRQFWPPLLRFAIWVWIANLLCHLFGVVDRYMIVHFSGMDNDTALAQVGNYHSSRIVPLLFVSVADLLSGVLLPYLSHDWESGQRDAVSSRTNLVLKFTSLAMFAGGIIVLWGAPLLFHVAFEGKYDDGMVVLPWTLTYCVWYALLLIGQDYLWCAERTRLSTLPLAVGLVANIVLNLILLPRWGLSGAVIATTIATALALGVLLALNAQAGMRLPAGTIYLVAAPLALCAGPETATVVFLAVLLAAFGPSAWIPPEERQTFEKFFRDRFISRKPRWDQSNSQEYCGTAP